MTFIYNSNHYPFYCQTEPKTMYGWSLIERMVVGNCCKKYGEYTRAVSNIYLSLRIVVLYQKNTLDGLCVEFNKISYRSLASQCILINILFLFRYTVVVTFSNPYLWVRLLISPCRTYSGRHYYFS